MKSNEKPKTSELLNRTYHASKNVSALAPVVKGVARRVAAPLGAAIGAYDIARLGKQAIEGAKGKLHAAKTKKHSEQRYGSIKRATQTRRQRSQKKGLLSK